MADCSVVLKNLGLSQCNKLPGLIKGMITTPRTFSLSQVDALDVTKWQDAILAAAGARIYLWPNFRDFKDSSEKAVYEETPLSSLKVRDGRYRFEVSVKESLCVHKAMFTHSGNATQRVFLLDTQNQIIGSLDANGNVVGFDVELLNVEKMMFSDGKVSTKTPIYLVLSDNLELDQNGIIVDGSSIVPNLIRLTDVDIAQVGSATTSLIKVTVKTTCDGINVEGFAAADFQVYSSAGVQRTISTVTYANGVYSLNSSAAFTVGDYVDLKAASALTIEGYESTGAKVTV